MSELEGITAGGYLPASFLDWDGHISAVIFTSGCNFRCPWCHNSDLVMSKTEPVLLNEIIEDIIKRKKFLDGIVISGGEPCLWAGLMPVLYRLKQLGFPVKLDTNGSFPHIISQIIKAGLVDFVAMDIKAPLQDNKLEQVTGVRTNAEDIRKSIDIIRTGAVSYEFRTTYVPRLLSADDLAAVCKELNDDAHWVVQCFKPVNCLEDEYMSMPPVKPEDLQKILKGVRIRG